jgi:SAM-dependent methyltransferase
MPPASLEPTRRFSDRVHDYARARPGYPEALFDTLAAAAGLRAGSAVADVGSGTGISSEPFLRRGCAVYGVEPNADMRLAAEARFAAHAGFTSVDGVAEATTLADASVDLVTVAQAFHWFDRARTRREFARILRPGGAVGLYWNWRAAGTPFVEAYEAIIERFGTDFAAVRSTYAARRAEGLADFFGGPFETRTFSHTQALDLDGLRALLLSSSFTPPAGHPDREPMLHAIDRAFAEHARGGRVEIPYDTELHVGRLAPIPAPSPEDGACSQ